jgi:hypothetical protein
VKNRNLDEFKSAEVFTFLALGIYEGFLSCWTEKYKSNAMRPETYINRLISPQWKSYIETPPFPEYTSGHSIISSASAMILTKIFGDNTPFVDNTERAWGWPDRKYDNVKQAANEAALSRLYGGIHYREGMEQGMVEGEKIGELVFNKLN